MGEAKETEGTTSHEHGKLRLSPDQTLSFRRPFTSNVKELLNVTNTCDDKVAFKVKTTAPRLYTVRPNSGVLEPHETKEIQVILQGMKDDIQPDSKARDKFLIQSIVLLEEEASLPLQQLWNQCEATRKGDIKEYKLRCQYLPPLEAMPQNTSESSRSSYATDSSSYEKRITESVGMTQRQTSSTSLAKTMISTDPSKAQGKKQSVQGIPNGNSGGGGSGLAPIIVVILMMVAFALGFQISAILR